MTSLLHTSDPAPSRGRRRVVAVALVTMIVVAVVAAAPTVVRMLRNPAEADPVIGVDDITVHNDAFDPPVIQTEPGTTVTWTFEDGDRPHNVVTDDWASDVLTTATYSHTFTEPGSHPYRCTLHWGMEGRVDVVATR
ncbi:MAG TPA: plastocyanin/azurin family copper-binding protein [Euzebya sp.]|nr:plastocyanin/azurin family copper-binding protein [Euzebya sp.]